MHADGHQLTQTSNVTVDSSHLHAPQLTGTMGHENVCCTVKEKATGGQRQTLI
jgi:hypothetical protein